MAAHRFLCGTYTRPEGHVPHGKGSGISLFSIDTAVAQFTTPTHLTFQKPLFNPSYVALLPGRSGSDTQLAAAVQEAGTAEGDEVVVFEFDSLTGKVLQELWIPTGGIANCHILLFPVGNRVLCACAGYCSGAVHVVDTKVCVKTDQPGSFLWPEGEESKVFSTTTVAFPKELAPKDAPGRDVARQDGPHAHQVIPLDRLALDGSATQLTLLSFDLGGDFIGSICVNNQEFFSETTRPFTALHQLPLGTGPRHGALHGTKPLLFVLGELSATVVVLGYSRSAGNPGQVTFTNLSQIQYGSTPGKHLGAALRLHRSGDHLVVSSRFDNQLVVLSTSVVDSKSQEQEASVVVVEKVSTRGLTPRDIAFDPTGQWLVVGNQDSDDMQLYRWGGAEGSGAGLGLLQWVASCSVGTPVCVAFL